MKIYLTPAVQIDRQYTTTAVYYRVDALGGIPTEVRLENVPLVALLAIAKAELLARHEIPGNKWLARLNELITWAEANS